MRSKAAETEENHSPSQKFENCSAPFEVTEAPQSSRNAKTTEYAFFKKLKLDLGRNFPISVDKESMSARSFRTSKNLREMGSSKYDDFKSSLNVKKSKTGDISNFPSPKEAALENFDMTKNVHKDCNRFKSPALIKTPTNINLDSFLSRNTDAYAKPEQCKSKDIFSLKRLKLKHQILRTLFPEADELPKELRA